MKKSIKTRLVKYFMLVILITVLTLEIVLLTGVRDYYYSNVEDILSNQIDFSTDFYSRYFNTFNLEDILIDDIDIFWRYTNAQVQILSLDGKVLMDSLGVVHNENMNTNDVTDALNMDKGVWVGNVNYDDYPVMSVSKVLMNKGEQIGIIRFVSSLETTNIIIRRISFLFFLMGIMVIFISAMVSLFLANSIIKPLTDVTKVAEKMADGQFKVRSYVKIDDEIKKLSDTLNYMAEEIMKKDQIKNDFISSVSHELRTPLTAIKGWAITLQTDEYSEDELLMDGLNIIETESDRLSQMVEDLLDFSRFISGRIILQKEEFNIIETINMIGKQWSPRAKTNNINFVVDIDQDPIYIIGDENRIKQVLINLLDNAFKFTNEDGIVRLSAIKEGNHLVLEVEDNGIGIPAEDLPNIVEKFYKGKHSKSHSGIGLSICDEIVKLHDGKMTIESEVDKGTLIKVFLPLKENDI
ncbi:MAG: HAMP domain-containing histidine kinase [Tissierellia bacterium]|nr:HAMP domain-containing histidine kinase [Tissierellia bacterium]